MINPMLTDKSYFRVFALYIIYSEWAEWAMYDLTHNDQYGGEC